MKKPGLFLGIILIVFAVVLNCCEKEEDILPPFCNIEMPSDSSEFPFGDTITINVEAVDSNGYIKMVLFYIDDLAKFSTSSAPYQFKWSTLNEIPGFHIIRAAAFDRSSNSSSDECIIELVIGPPVVITANVSSVTNNSAICGGNVINNGGATVTARGVCWSTAPNPIVDNAKGYTTDSAGTGSYTSYLAGLSRATTYYVRAYATNSKGTSYGEQVEFVTEPTSIAVTTSNVISITSASAVCGGEVTDDGGLSVTARGVCWNTTGEPTLSDNYTTNGTGTGIFTSTITGLSNKTKYYVRAYAINSNGTKYGNTISFTTSAALPEVITGEVSLITCNSAQIEVNVIDDGGALVTAKGVCWSTSPNPMINDNKTNDGSETGSFTSTLINLEPNTTYYVRAYATNSVGTAYGEVEQFTTLKKGPEYFEYLLVSNRSDVYRVDNQGNLSYLFHGTNVEVYNKKIYTYFSSEIKEYNIDGVLTSTIPIPDEVKYFVDFTILPEKGFAFLDNKYDKVYFTDLNGNFLRTVSIPNVTIDGDNHLQNINGLKVDNKIVISENGENQIFSIDLDRYDSTILKDLSQLSGWLGAITFANNKFYICQSRKIYSFSGNEEPTLLCTLTEYHITGIVVLDKVAYVTVNFADKIFMVDLENGEYKEFVHNVLFPEDLDVFR